MENSIAIAKNKTKSLIKKRIRDDWRPNILSVIQFASDF
jgi:hypothetical protein